MQRLRELRRAAAEHPKITWNEMLCWLCSMNGIDGPATMNCERLLVAF
jgi:hypothetical protein